MQYHLYALVEQFKQAVQALREEEGQDLIEYALLAAIIALGAVLTMNQVANQINAAFSAINSTINSAIK